MKFTRTLDCGVLGEIECDVVATIYCAPVERVDDRSTCTIDSVAICINGIKHDILDELSEERVMELQEEASDRYAGETICAAEARADARREDALLESMT